MLLIYTVQVFLWVLLAFGLFLAIRASHVTFIGHGDPCLDIGGIYICYIILISYIEMILAQVRTWWWRKSVFYIGWVVTFIIATAETILELIIGNTCFKCSNNLPMYYVSLVLCGAIIALYTFYSVYIDEKIND